MSLTEAFGYCLSLRTVLFVIASEAWQSPHYNQPLYSAEIATGLTPLAMTINVIVSFSFSIIRIIASIDDKANFLEVLCLEAMRHIMERT